MIERSRKKLEKSLKDAKDEVAGLTERLNVSQAECNFRDEKIKALIKQLESKTNELKNQSKQKQVNSDNQKQGATIEELSEKDNEINLLRVKLKRMEQEIKILNRKLTKSGIEIQDLAAEIKEISEEEKKEEAINSTDIPNNEQAENSSEFKINDFEIKEIDVLKYKFEQDIITLKKDYETQLEQITITVMFFL